MTIVNVSKEIVRLMENLKAVHDASPSVANGHALASLGAALKCHEDDVRARTALAEKAEKEAEEAAKATKKAQEERKANLEAKVHDLRKLRKDHPKTFTMAHKHDLEEAKNSLAGLLQGMGITAPDDLLYHEDYVADQEEQKKREELAAKKKDKAPAPVAPVTDKK